MVIYCKQLRFIIQFISQLNNNALILILGCISKFSAGSIHYYPGYHHQLGRLQVEKFSGDLKRYLTRRIGFEAVMRIRCTRGELIL